MSKRVCVLPRHDFSAWRSNAGGSCAIGLDQAVAWTAPPDVASQPVRGRGGIHAKMRRGPSPNVALRNGARRGPSRNEISSRRFGEDMPRSRAKAASKQMPPSSGAARQCVGAPRDHATTRSVWQTAPPSACKCNRAFFKPTRRCDQKRMPMPPSRSIRSIIHLEGFDKRRLRDFHFAELAHLFLAGLLLFQQLFLARGVAAIALGRHILAHRRQRFTRNHA